MALTPPTVASDPATATHTNTALAAINVFVTNSITKSVAALQILRDRAVLVGGSIELLNAIDRVLSTIGGQSHADPTVAASPATQTQTNSAFATFTGYIDTLNANLASAFAELRQHFRMTHGNVLNRERFTTATVNIATPAVQTAITVASDPVSQADMNTALASATALVDTFNVELAAVLDTFTMPFRLNPGNQILALRLENAIVELNA